MSQDEENKLANYITRLTLSPSTYNKTKFLAKCFFVLIVAAIFIIGRIPTSFNDEVNASNSSLDNRLRAFNKFYSSNLQCSNKSLSKPENIVQLEAELTTIFNTYMPPNTPLKDATDYLYLNAQAQCVTQNINNTSQTKTSCELNKESLLSFKKLTIYGWKIDRAYKTTSKYQLTLLANKEHLTSVQAKPLCDEHYEINLPNKE